jgi:osmotically-inducible protein OsmY
MENVMNRYRLLYTLPVAAFAILSLSGCIAALIAGGAETATVVAQERSVGGAVDDAGILLKIKNKFAEEKAEDIRGKDMLRNVEVKVIEGRVLLTGNVDKPESQIDAVNLTWQVAGVKEVINEIQINDQSGVWNYTRDVWVSTQVRSRLVLEKGVRSINYSIITVNQVVYVMGIAQNQAELDKVTQIASTTNYVKRVVSYARMKDDPRRGYLPE